MRTSAKSKAVPGYFLSAAAGGVLEGAAVAGVEVAALLAPSAFVEPDADLLEAPEVLPAPSPEDFGLALP